MTRIENACADAWPAVVDEPLGGWRPQAAGGFTGRGNAALAVDDPGRALPDALAAVCDFAHQHASPPTLQDGPVERELPALGRRPCDEHPRATTSEDCSARRPRCAVHPEQRGQGLARALRAAIGAWGERRAAACVLQVASDNAAAPALYERLEFREHHRYRYWTPCEDRTL